MADRVDETTRILGPLGAEVMNVLWSASEPLAVRSVMERLNASRREPLAYTTVMTVLGRLTDRGAARRTGSGRAYLYEAAVQDVAELAVRDVLRDHGDAAVAYFVDHAKSDARLRRRLERLVKPEDSEARKGSSGSEERRS